MSTNSPNAQRILFGAAYYEEYEYNSKLEEDMRLLQAAHMNVIRVGESVWSRWEPTEGDFHLDWLEPILDAAQRHHIHAIIGLPTYAIPMWMARLYPDIALQNSWGVKRGFGAREEHNVSHPAFRFYAERLCRKIVERYRDHPAVIGWQLHNEPGVAQNDSPSAFEGFKNWLHKKYGSVDNLNKAWGLVYWSHELSDWADLWQPESNAQPQYDMDWRRYQAELTDELLAWQHDVIAELRRPEQFITVNYAPGRYACDEAESSEHLDIAGTDPYFQMQDGMLLPTPGSYTAGWAPCGAFSPQLWADRSYGLKQAPYLVMETNGGPIDGSHVNFPAYNGQWRQAAWQFISRGAQMVEYWQWRQIKFGTEEYWGGVIPHDDKPGRVYEQLSQLGAELEQAGSRVSSLQPDCDVAMLYSIASRWALSATSPIPAADGSAKNDDAFDHIFRAFYEGAFDSGHQVRVVYDSQLVNDSDLASGAILWDPRDFARRFPTLVAAGVYICSDNLLAWLRAYVQAGGHLILGPRTAYANSVAGIRSQVKPSELAEISKTHYQEFSNLSHPLPVYTDESTLKLCGTSEEMSVVESHSETSPAVSHLLPAFPENAQATQWIDCLISDGARVLARTDHPHFAQFPLVTTCEAGTGRVTMVGTIPNRALAGWIFDVADALNDTEDEKHGEKHDSQAHDAQSWRDAVRAFSTVRHTSAINSSGEHLHFVYNFSWDSVTISLPYTCTRFADAQEVSSLTLGPWDVQIVIGH